MRILFKKGKQKGLLRKEKEFFKLTWPQFADYLDIKYGRLITYVNEDVLIDIDTFCKLRFGDYYRIFIEDLLDDYWGKSKGGLI